MANPMTDRTPTEANKLTAAMARGHNSMLNLYEIEKGVNSELRKALDSRNKEIVSLKDTVSKLDTNNSSLRGKFDVLRKQYDGLEVAHNETMIAFKERGNTIESAAKQASEAASIIETLRNENKALNGQFNASIKTAHEHIGAYNDETYKVARLEHTVRYERGKSIAFGIVAVVSFTILLYASLN